MPGNIPGGESFKKQVALLEADNAQLRQSLDRLKGRPDVSDELARSREELSRISKDNEELKAALAKEKDKGGKRVLKEKIEQLKKDLEIVSRERDLLSTELAKSRKDGDSLLKKGLGEEAKSLKKEIEDLKAENEQLKRSLGSSAGPDHQETIELRNKLEKIENERNLLRIELSNAKKQEGFHAGFTTGLEQEYTVLKKEIS